MITKEDVAGLTTGQLFKKLPPQYYVCQKCLWCDDSRIEIDHLDNDLDKELDYRAAAIRMLNKLESASA